jgi:hypothetical protein
MKNALFKKVLILLLMVLISANCIYSQDFKKIQRTAARSLESWENPFKDLKHIGKLKIDSLKTGENPDRIILFFSPTLSYYPIREENAKQFVQSLKKSLGRRFRKYRIDVYSNGYSLYQLIPNYFRLTTSVDSSRIKQKTDEKKVLVRRYDNVIPSKGLYTNSLALWHSHGYYFEMNLDRWEWQRARLFGTVEDISVLGYVLPYLTRMLENAGANVYLPRERDTQLNEVIVDNDISVGRSEFLIYNGEPQRIGKGFLLTDTIFPGVNPFIKGTSLRIKGDSAIYIPDIPEDGDYAVYISYPQVAYNSGSVIFNVNHTGGRSGFIVDQTIGGETWIYLGTFRFRAGKNPSTGSVLVRNRMKDDGFIALDAIRFGGGMGNVARRPSPEIIKNQKSVNDTVKPDSVKADLSDNPDFSWKLSRKPRYLEAARYYLQYAGMPDTLVYSPTLNKNDYNDDYQSRGFWVNYLSAPCLDSTGKSLNKGLGIPIDLSIALHTDAGITSGDSIIGTLAIYSTGADKGLFPDGSSRLASRDLSDIIQTEVVEDIRDLYYPDWTRRGLWDRPYSEARRPNVPGILLEMLSHQNQGDQKFGLDPRFRFSVSRSIYKGVLKYMAYIENREYVVQPLPVSNFAITPAGGKRIRLSWEPVTDKLEPTSVPSKYRIYKRVNENGFDNGIISELPFTEFELEDYDTVYSFKVTAINDGGESFESEILSAGLKQEDTEGVLIVNGFDRISGPTWFDRDMMAGVAWWHDRGVPDHFDFSTVGDQYDFDRTSPWLDDDSPGWGASSADLEGKMIPGNSFDYPVVHGQSILEAGHSFFSVSDEYFCSGKITPGHFKTIDLIFGEEKSTPFFNDTSRIDYKIYSVDFMKKIKELTQAGTNIFMSGAYVGSDLIEPGDSTNIKFARDYLHFLPRTGHAVNRGELYSTDYAKPLFTGSFRFNTAYSEKIYSVEAPDAIEAAGKGAICAFRYSQNNTSAGIIFMGSYKTVILGFPFETITSKVERNNFMKQVLDFFK